MDFDLSFPSSKRKKQLSNRFITLLTSLSASSPCSHAQCPRVSVRGTWGMGAWGHGGPSTRTTINNSRIFKLGQLGDGGDMRTWGHWGMGTEHKNHSSSTTLPPLGFDTWGTGRVGPCPHAPMSLPPVP